MKGSGEAYRYIWSLFPSLQRERGLCLLREELLTKEFLQARRDLLVKYIVALIIRHGCLSF